MTAWSEYLREQAIVADRVAAAAPSPESRKEFENIAASYRRDADIEEGASGSDSNCPPLIDLPPRRRAAPVAASC